jgi:endonuclease YncB( thermonuclease family)
MKQRRPCGAILRLDPPGANIFNCSLTRSCQMAAYRHLHTATRDSGRWGRNYLFVLMLSLVYIASFYACSGPDTARRVVELLEPGVPITGRAWVVDGDTIRLAGISIRLQGIDAPEKTQTCTDSNGRTWLCGEAATRELRDRIRGRDVTCRPRARDRYGRVVATCSLADGSDLNAWLVRGGWAVASGFSKIYVSEEGEAKAAKRGIWAGSFIAPAEWRRHDGHNAHHRWSGWQR